MAGRLESRNLVINPIPLDVIPLLEESIAAVKPMAKMKQIRIELNSTHQIPFIRRKSSIATGFY